jgi:hypothetical protein
MYNKIIAKFQEKELGYRGKVEVLTKGVCKAIFPVSIVKSGKSITGYYVTSGYKRLSDCKELTAEQVLTVVHETVTALEECNKYLIFPEEFLITLDTTYIKENFDNIKFTYIPDENKRGATKKISSFIKSLKSVSTENGKLYLDMLDEIFLTENLNTLKVKALISQLKREVNLCNVT